VDARHKAGHDEDTNSGGTGTMGISLQDKTKIVRDRYERNLAQSKPKITKDRFWRAMVCMRITTQTDSGPMSAVAAFQRHKPFPLSYDVTRTSANRLDFIQETLKNHGLTRMLPTVSKQLNKNFNLLEGGEWQHALDQCNRLVRLEQRTTEIAVADYIAKKFDGFGMKQSRNILQALGLTRYEIPIDSRVACWLNQQLKFPFNVDSTCLSNKKYYIVISDAIYKLCEVCKIFPCVLDASIFSAKDGDAQSLEELHY
jgi:thermostable 8-oxoguanine DNA glycosylase